MKSSVASIILHGKNCNVDSDKQNKEQNYKIKLHYSKQAIKQESQAMLLVKEITAFHLVNVKRKKYSVCFSFFDRALDCLFVCLLVTLFHFEFLSSYTYIYTKIYIYN